MFVFDKRQLAADLVEPVLDGGIADAEILLHLFDGSMAAHERRDEDLVFGGQSHQRRQRKRALDHHAGLDEADTFDFDGGLPDEFGEFLPVASHNEYRDMIGIYINYYK